MDVEADGPVLVEPAFTLNVAKLSSSRFVGILPSHGIFEPTSKGVLDICYIEYDC